MDQEEWNLKSILLSGCVVSFLLMSQWVCADEAVLTYDRINLSIVVEEQVKNDILVVEMYALAEGEDSQKLSADVNQRMAKAVKMTKGMADIKAQTLNYRVTPRYQGASSFRDRRLIGWSVRQSLRLSSSNILSLTELVGRLQKVLSVQNMSYEISAPMRKQAEDRLIEQAIKDFSERAELVSKALGKPDYRVVQLNISTSGSRPAPHMRSMAVSSDAMSAPAVEAGTAKVRVNINATIEGQVRR